MSFFSQTAGGRHEAHKNCRSKWGRAVTHALTIRPVPGRFAVARLAADADCPPWLNGPGFQALIRAEDELTLVCHEDRVPLEVEAERDWVCLRTVGRFPFEAAGIVQSLVAPLSENGIGVFVVCTFDGEHVLVPAEEADAARRFLEAAGHRLDAG